MLNIHELLCIALARPYLDGEKLIEIQLDVIYVEIMMKKKN